ncbi:MAG: DUF4032 domain-containing protein [Melioribacteraceae bacterium]|nr:DUF4032 domain-containing protein [Melioribacteraceae bacterium]
MNEQNLIFNIYQRYRNDLISLPWDTSLIDWQEDGFKFISVRKSKSRHPVRFIKTKNYSFAIKQTSNLKAYFESVTYKKLLEKGIPTFVPAGHVIYTDKLFTEEHKLLAANQDEELAFVVTMLEDNSIPHSILFQYDFKEENTKAIIKAIAELIALLHHKNIYWGDAQLQNNLIKFNKLKDANGRTKTELKAFLADAETVEITSKISDEMREKDISKFFESIDQYNLLLIEQGKEKDISFLKSYFGGKYEQFRSLYKTIKAFEKTTGINVHDQFGEIKDKNTIDDILKQIEEHKWYLNENQVKEITIQEASIDWLRNIYAPIIKEFEALKIADNFPNTNSASLYAQIMAHKYYMSLEVKKDVGVKNAILDYAENFATSDKSFLKNLKLLVKRILVIYNNYPDTNS